MPRGRKNPDPTLEGETDLLIFKEQLYAIAAGAKSPIDILKMARLCEGLVYQYRSRLPKNSLAKFDALVKRAFEEALILSAYSSGERELLELSVSMGHMEPGFAEWHRARIDIIDEIYLAKMASDAAVLFEEVEAKAASKGSGRGRKAGRFGKQALVDGALLQEVFRRLPPEHYDSEAIKRAIRNEVAGAIRAGRLPALGHPDVPKEAIDAHTKRVVRYWRRVTRTSPK